MKRKLLTWLLIAAVFVGMIPSAAIIALAEELETTYTLSDKYISVSVSKANGGFTVRTVEGDRLQKSDNDKDLLYHDGAYDTSFISVRVGEGANQKDYIFGGTYSTSTDVEVTEQNGSIKAVWGVDGIVFTQSISLQNTSSKQSGMINLNISAQNNKNEDVPVQVRVLYDTALGSQDYGHYQYSGSKTAITNEQIMDSVPQQIYAVNDVYNPTVYAYSVSGTTPKKAAFGHWSHLASTIFDFEPLTSLDFTNTRNEYMTSDSAYALYYDLGTVKTGSAAELSTFYGVFSNHQTPASDSVAVNLTSPVRLTLNDEKSDFVPEDGAIGIADFAVTVNFANIEKKDAEDLEDIVLVVRSSGNLRSLKDDGSAADGQEFNMTDRDPFEISYSELKVGGIENKTLYFDAKPGTDASYERITVGVYKRGDLGEISETNKLGERIAYVLLPGTDGDVPQVNFASMTPSIVYKEGTRHLFVTVNNESLLDDRGNWKLKAYSEDGKHSVNIPNGETEGNITFKDGIMDVALTNDIQLSEGGWYLQLEWTDDAVAHNLVTNDKKFQTAPVLHFTVSADKKYKNDAYSVIAVVEIFDGSNFTHRIDSYKDEESFEAYRAEHEHGADAYNKYEEVLLFFKGEFIKSNKAGETSYTAVSTKERVDGEDQVDNPIIINGCMDFEGGTMKVYKDSEGSICTEFDGELYTNTERTYIWKGEALLTKIESGEDYTLIPYNENGERHWYSADGNRLSEEWVQSGTTTHRANNMPGKPITLVWPSTLGAIGQTISGMIFKMAYAQLGIMYDTENQTNKIEDTVGYVLSFTASLDLSFANGKVDESKAEPPSFWSELTTLMAMYDSSKQSFSKYFYKAGRNESALFLSDINEEGNKDNHKGITAAVMVRDVLFGCGEGFVGVNFEVGVSIKNYVSALPEIEGTIAVNTVNNWSYGIDGKIDLEAFTVEAKVAFESSDGIPIPDELYVFVSGFEPGLNIDGCGVVWITGGGGGISNIYDSIFMTQAVPPLKLTLSVSFDLLKILSCEKASLSLGLTGISLQAEEITIKKVDSLKAIDKMGLSFEWYPGIDLRANIVVNLFQGTVRGGGYIVLLSPDYKDVFFEMFARAQLSVPQSIPVVGGMTIAGTDLGINTKKIWGAIDILSITLGVTYYWGEGSVDFGSGSKTSPTFPDLLGYDDIPVYYDEENDQTLYARVGTNTSLMASTLDDTSGVELMGSASLICNDGVNKNSYKFNLGTRTDGNDAIVQITFDAADMEEAKAKAAAIKVGSSDGASDYALKLFDTTKDQNAKENQGTNANLSYDADTKKATYAFTVTEPSAYDKDWYLKAPIYSDVLLYNVEEVPEITLVSGSGSSGSGSSSGSSVSVSSGAQMTLNWDGTSLGDLDQVSFYLCENNDAESTDAGYRLAVVDSNLGSKSSKITVPEDVPTGDYYIRAVYSKSDEVNGVKFSDKKISVENSDTPEKVSYDAKTAGNLQYKLTIPQNKNTDGYLVTIYDAEENVTDFENVSYEAAESGDTEILVGGSYTAADENGAKKTVGLTGGESYTIGVTPYKKVEAGSNGGSAAVYGTEVKTSSMKLPVMKTPKVTFSADKKSQTRTETQVSLVDDGNGGTKEKTSSYEKTIYTADELVITAKASENVSGTWKLDSAQSGDKGKAGTFKDSASIPIKLTDLEEGEHTITVEGAAESGDSFYDTYNFTVDTMPPQLLISSPVNGSFVGTSNDGSGIKVDGKVTISGVTDTDAVITVAADGQTLCRRKLTDSEINASTGAFTMTLNMPDFNSDSKHTLKISVADDVGNAAPVQTIEVSHGGLAILDSIEVSVDDFTYSEGNIPVSVTGIKDAKLALAGIASDGTRFNISGDNVSWDITTAEGKASIEDGKLTAEAGSQGIITGKLAVAEGVKKVNDENQIDSSSYRTAALCFGAPASNTVAVSSNTGGTVTGGGTYQPGETVTLTATANKGYHFVGWTFAGVTVDGAAGETVTFAMPENGNVTAVASFAADKIKVERDDDDDEGDGLYAEAGSVVKEKTDGLPYYIDSDGSKVFVPVTASIDGETVFIAPRSTEYFFKSNPVSFNDTSGHWAADDILFAAEREIFKGVGGGAFNPNGSMTRAMFATVLYRIAGSPAVKGKNSFSDVAANQWYTDAIIWGKSEGIIEGYDDGRFGTNDLVTREQMCTLLARYLKWAGYDLQTTAARSDFADQAQISTWAAESVSFCQTRGLINGRTNNMFVPKDSATRAENCAVFHRLILAILTSVK